MRRRELGVFLLLLVISFVVVGCKEEIGRPEPPAGTYVFGGEDREAAGDLIELPDGNLLLVGGKVGKDRADYDTYLAIVTTDGTLVQDASFGDSDVQELGYRVLQLQDGNYAVLVVTRTASYGQPSVQLLKVDASLNLISEGVTVPVNVSGTPVYFGAGFLEMDNGQFLITYTSDFVPYKQIMNADGSIASNEVMPGMEGYENRHRLCRLQNGQFAYVAGPQASYLSPNTFMARVFNDQGIYLVTNTYPNALIENCTVGAATLLSNGDVALSMSDLTDRRHEFGFLHPAGNYEPAGTAASTSNFAFSEIDELPNGDIALMGYPSLLQQYSYNTGNDDIAVQVRDSAGRILRTTTFGGEDVDRPRGMIALSDGRVAILGETQSYGAGTTDLYLVIFEY